MWDNLTGGAAAAFTVANIGSLAFGTFVGIVVGILPGIGPMVGMVMLLPFTFALAPDVALSLLLGVFCGGYFGGAVPAILMRTPGVPSSLVTSFDGFPLTRKGEAQTALSAALHEANPDAGARQAREERVERFQQERRQRRQASLTAARNAKPISYAFIGECIREQMPQNGLVVTELGVSADQLGLEEPGSLIGVGIGGGLGFGLGAALGAKLADRSRCVIATLGDGSYMFGNPTPFHFVARAADLPVLTIICNNRRWHAVDASTRIVYPDGSAAHAKPMPLVEFEPSPEFTKVAEASDAFARKVEDPADLPGALSEALEAVASGRQALLDVRVEHGDRSSG